MKMSVAMAFSQHTAAGFIKDAVQLVEEKGCMAYGCLNMCCSFRNTPRLTLTRTMDAYPVT